MQLDDAENPARLNCRLLKIFSGKKIVEKKIKAQVAERFLILKRFWALCISMGQKRITLWNSLFTFDPI